MKAPFIRSALSLTLTAVIVAPAVPVASQTVSVSSDKGTSAVVTVRDVKAQGGVVSGVVTNGSDHLLRDVKLVIRHAWLWKDERHPGTDNPGRAEYYSVAGEIPPGASVPFTYHVDPPLPQRSDGRYSTSTEVVSFTEIGR